MSTVFKEVVIPRDKIRSDLYALNERGCGCYVAHIAAALGVKRREGVVLRWAWDRFGREWEAELSYACFERDEPAAIAAAASVAIPIRFVDSLDGDK